MSYQDFTTLPLKMEIHKFNRLTTEQQQMYLCSEFNAYVERKRTETWSLFLPQFRESKEYARKRIPFELAYTIVLHLISIHLH